MKKFFENPTSLLFIGIIFGVIVIATTIITYGFSGEETLKKSIVNPNKFAKSNNPYLLRQSRGLVNWYPWGSEAFNKARDENKPIFVSIGYSACYWCYAMEKQVFNDPNIAKLMNDSVISIKIDREERPDIDDIYMTATKVISNGNGWPNSVFITPDLKPFAANSYMTSYDFLSFFNNAVSEFSLSREVVEKRADDVVEEITNLRKQENADLKARPSSKLSIKDLQEYLISVYDNEFGGFSRLLKYPNENMLLFLLANYRSESNKQSLGMVQNTLHHISKGGITDHVDGGVFRRTIDSKWQVSTFEKMLYNQALTGLAYSKMYEISKSNIDKYAANRIYDYVLQKMTHSKGGFYASVNSQTDGVDGAYYSWSRVDLEVILEDSQLEWFNKYYGLADIASVKEYSNNYDKSLYLTQIIPEEEVKKNEEIMRILSIKRSKRKIPSTDNKIITAWNGLMIHSLANAGEILHDDRYIKAAQRSADFILNNSRKSDGSLYRIWRNGRANTDAFFEDYAFMIQGLVSLYRVTAKAKYLGAAMELMDKAKEIFLDNRNNGYFSAGGTEELLVNMRNAKDFTIPSGNSVMVHALLDLYEITDDKRYKEQAEKILAAFSSSISKTPQLYPHMIHGLMRYYDSDSNNKKEQVDVKVQIPSNENYTEVSVNTKDYLKIYIPKELFFDSGPNESSFVVNVEIKEGWHVNANPASLEFLIPTSVDVRSDDGKVEIKDIQYPKSRLIKTPLGKIGIYEGNISIPVKITAPKNVKDIRVLVRSQACKDTSCLLPSDWVIPLEISKIY